jgi:pimeloyl-ACP methyl ester carboxylesterase
MKHLLFFAAAMLNVTQSFSQTPKKIETVTLNGTGIYYEVYGKGEPLFLLHGYTQSSKYWVPYLADYVNDFEVYLVDLKGHGKSSPFTETLSIKAAAMDIEALIKYLKLDSIKAIGYSYGGDVLFQLAILRPGLIKSMISIGACGTWNAKDYPDWIEYLSYKNIANLKWIHEQQTNEKQIRAILDQFPNYQISIREDELKTIQTKTLIVLGDQDTSVVTN